MKRFDRKKEIVKMQRLYDNCSGIHDKMDLVDFSYKYYDDQIKQLERLREFWTSRELQPADDNALANKELSRSKRRDIKAIASIGTVEDSKPKVVIRRKVIVRRHRK